MLLALLCHFNKVTNGVMFPVSHAYYYISPSVDRGRGHIALPLSAQCVCPSSVRPAVSIVQAERRLPQQTQDVDLMLG